MYCTYCVLYVVLYDVLQLQQLLSDELCKELMQLFSVHREAGGAGGPVGTAYTRQVAELTYHRQATQLLSDEYCFRIVFVSLQPLRLVLPTLL